MSVVGDLRKFARTAAAVAVLSMGMTAFAAPASASESAQESKAPSRYCHELSGHPANRPQICIRAKTYAEDLCHALAVTADAQRLPRGFFARLIWRESRFDPNAESPKGALGVAQFIPSTAKLRGLANPFNPAEALVASARYLRDLNALFGNLGLAAAAYNGGENRMRRMIAENSVDAPLETENYVRAITGHAIKDWMTKPPAEIDFSLGEDKAKTNFHDSCLALAETRKIRQFQVEKAVAKVKPWGVQITAHRTRQSALQLFERAKLMLPEPLRAERPVLNRIVFAGRRQYSVQYGRADRIDAIELCVTLRVMGISCTVVKN